MVLQNWLSRLSMGLPMCSLYPQTHTGMTARKTEDRIHTSRHLQMTGYREGD